MSAGLAGWPSSPQEPRWGHFLAGACNVAAVDGAGCDVVGGTVDFADDAAGEGAGFAGGAGLGVAGDAGLGVGIGVGGGGGGGDADGQSGEALSRHRGAVYPAGEIPWTAVAGRNAAAVVGSDGVTRPQRRMKEGGWTRRTSCGWSLLLPEHSPSS